MPRVAKSIVFLTAAALLLSALPLLAQLNRSMRLEQRFQPEEQQEKQQKKPPTTQSDRIPLDGVIDRDEYILGPGDEIELSISGGEQYNSYNLYVTAEGRLLLPSVGPVEVGQLTVNQAERVLREKSAIFYTGADVSLSLVNPRIFRAFVLGGVFDPGAYYMSAVDRVSDLIKDGGGLKPEASRRWLKLMDRDHNLLAEVDLMAWGAGLGPQSNPRLIDGCTVEAPPLRDYVTLRGHFVNLSGTDSIRISDYLKEEATEYRVEFKPGESLHDLLRLVGLPRQFDDSAGGRYIVLERQGQRRTLAMDDTELTRPLAAGVIYEFPVRTQWVYVTGNVTRAGRFLYEPGFTVNDYLGQAGGANWSGSEKICLVTRPDGTRGKLPSTAEVGPGDLLYVPGRVQWLDRTIGPLIGLVGVLIAVTAR